MVSCHPLLVGKWQRFVLRTLSLGCGFLRDLRKVRGLFPELGRAPVAFSLQPVLFLSQLLSLTLDGLTGVSHDHMRAHYQTGSNHMMLNINLWSTLLLGAGKEWFCYSSHVSAEGRLPSST